MKRIIYRKTEFLIIIVLITGNFFLSDVQAQTYLVNSGKIVFGASSTQLTVDNLSNNTGSNLNINGGTVNIKGSFVNNGSYDGTGTITFNGSSQQTLTGITAFNNLTINNSSGISLSGDITVNNNVNLLNGILTLGSHNLTLIPSATISGSFSSSKMINASGTGQMIKKFSSASSFLFPVGDNSDYSPLTLSFTGGTFAEGAYSGVNLKKLKHPGNLSSVDYLNRYWTVTPSGISNFNYDLTLGYNTSDVTGSENNLYLGKYYGSVWILYNQANIINHTLSLTNATSFGDFTAGQQSSMPVELTNLNSFVNNRDVTLKWGTSKEVNNSGFKIERTGFDNGKESWEQAGFVKGKGSSNTVTEYSFTDSKLSSGKYKYRIKQIDYNGNYSVYNLNNEIDILNPVKYSLHQNYPNPFNPNTKIDFELPNDDRVSLKIYDITGRVVYTVLNNEYKKAGYYTVNVSTDKLSSGVFFYKFEATGFSQVKKMIKLK